MHFDHTTGLPIIYGSSVKGVLRSYLPEILMEDEKYKSNSKEIVNAIFGESAEEGPGSIYKRDIFSDAVIDEGYEEIFLADDVITPHKDGPLKNPTPLTFLKIASGVCIDFRFRLVETVM